MNANEDPLSEHSDTSAISIVDVDSSDKKTSISDNEPAKPAINNTTDTTIKGSTAISSTPAKNRRGNRKGSVIGIMIMILGVLVLCYPLIMQLRNQQHEEAVVAEYAQDIADTEPDELAIEMKEAQEYNERLLQGGGTLYPLGSNESDKDKDYQGTLSASGAMATVSIPKISVNLPVYHGTTDNVLSAGAGHLYGTSLPVGGENTHAVIAAHRGMPTALMFTRLDELEIGDVFYINVLGERHIYRVDQIKVVQPGDVSNFSIEEGKDYVTLLTCTPYGVNTERLIVRGERMPEHQQISPAKITPEIGLYPAGYLALIILIATLTACAAIATFRRSRMQPHGLHIAAMSESAEETRKTRG